MWTVVMIRISTLTLSALGVRVEILRWKRRLRVVNVEIPVMRMLLDVGARSGQYSRVESFHFSVSLQMVGCRERVVHVDNLADVLEES